MHSGKAPPLRGELSRALLWKHHAGGGYAEPWDGLEAERDSSFPPMSDRTILLLGVEV